MTFKKNDVLTLLGKKVILAFFCFHFFLASNVVAQESPDNKANIMAAITLLLLQEETSTNIETVGQQVPIVLGADLQDPYVVSGDAFFEFELQPNAVEVCFDLSTQSTMLPEGLEVEVNGLRKEIMYGENCFALSISEQIETNVIQILVGEASPSITLNRIEFSNVSQSLLGLPSLTRSSWTNDSVRKILKVFAFGGHATDDQIELWAQQKPQDAIKEILNFDKHNLKLSPLAQGEKYRDTAILGGTLKEFSDFLSSSSSNLPIAQASRPLFKNTSPGFDKSFAYMATVRGLNPFRQRIGYWETNYHLAVNADLRPHYGQISTYYDDIMNAHESGVSYERVLGVAAKSAAIAAQYGHDLNFWREGPQRCDCNDDFAREIHQLFFGIFGDDDPNHEEGTIRETSKMLTGMRLSFVQGFGLADQVSFSSDFHHVNDLTILGANISGLTASEKIDNLMPVSIEHPESLKNLPVKIIAGLADSNLDEDKSDQLRAAWALMGANKNFLEFIQAYAISDLFHSHTQRKDFTSFERAAYLTNRFSLDNFETYRAGVYIQGARAGRDTINLLEDEAAGNIFSPTNNVFGGQSDLEAADSALVFEKNYNFQVADEVRTRLVSFCDDCDDGDSWEKKWSSVIPQSNGAFYVEDVASWLWRYVVGRSDNYTELERAYLLAFLGATPRSSNSQTDQDRSFDFPLLMCIVEDYQDKVSTADISLSNILSDGVWNQYCIKDDDDGEYSAKERELLSRVYSAEQITGNATIQALLDDIGQQELPLLLSGSDENDRLRHFAIQRVNTAIGFIFATPYVFTEAQ